MTIWVKKEEENFLVTKVLYYWFAYPSAADVKIDLEAGTYNRSSNINLDVPSETNAVVEVIGGDVTIERLNEIKDLVRVRSLNISAQCIYPEAKWCIKKAAEISQTRIQCQGPLNYCPGLPTSRWLQF